MDVHKKRGGRALSRKEWYSALRGHEDSGLTEAVECAWESK